jgi:SAM-dependent methyltransferase
MNNTRDAIPPFGAATGSASFPPVLDACCSIRAFWFDKKDGRALFVDKRSETIRRKDSGTEKGWRDLEIAPDIQADFTDLPFPDETFYHVVFDPPHKKREEYKGGFLVQQYGILNGDWKGMLKQGFSECFRVLKPGGTLIFKWCELEIPLREILALTDEKPLYGHRRKDHPMGTHWVAFLKPNAKLSDSRREQP